MTSATLEPGSFRDRNSRVFYADGKVLRGLSPAALEEWRALADKPLFSRLTETGALVRTEELAGEPVDLPRDVGEWAGYLEHEAIPFVSYPYEWSFGMLKDAALLQLDLLLAALEEGLTLQDATPYNVQWRGAEPVFIDVGSFRRSLPGEPWLGYRQFCELYLFPLFLQAYKRLPFHAWLRGSINGIEAEQCRRMMSIRDYFRRGVFTHVYLQSKLQARYKTTTRDVRAELENAGFHGELVKANVRGMRKLVGGLHWRDLRSVWAGYDTDNSYSDEDRQAKIRFVSEAVSSRRWRRVWDLGCNTGTFSRIAAGHADYVIATDADHAAVEIAYRRLAQDGIRNILPLVFNIADPSPNLGWRELERKSIVSRGRPDLVLSLALVHHLVIGANVPLRELLAWLAGLGSALVIEFVTKQDPMVQVLLRNRDDIFEDYDLRHFERWLGELFFARP